MRVRVCVRRSHRGARKVLGQGIWAVRDPVIASFGRVRSRMRSVVVVQGDDVSSSVKAEGFAHVTLRVWY